MSKKLLVRGFDVVPDRRIGFGDIFLHYAICYFKGKELNCNEVHTFRPECGTRHNLSIPQQNVGRVIKYLPVEIHNRDEKLNFDEFDEIVNIAKPGSLFHGHQGIRPHFWNTQKYLNLYYDTIGKNMDFGIGRDRVDAEYILIQFRFNAREQPAGNSSLDEFKTVFHVLKDQLGDKYEFWKIGEPTPIDNEFDNIVPSVWDDIEPFAKIVRNSSLLVSAHSGVQMYGWFFPDLPIITYGIFFPKSFANPYRWKSIVGTGFGRCLAPWIFERNLRFNKSELNLDKIVTFTEKWKL